MAWRADRRIYITTDRSRVCDETDPEGGILLAATGGILQDDVCKQYGLGPYAPKEAEPETEASQEGDKADTRPTTRQRRRAEDKALTNQEDKEPDAPDSDRS